MEIDIRVQMARLIKGNLTNLSIILYCIVALIILGAIITLMNLKFGYYIIIIGGIFTVIELIIYVHAYIYGYINITLNISIPIETGVILRQFPWHPLIWMGQILTFAGGINGLKLTSQQ